MANLPTGTITFVLTDVQGSTRRWESEPSAMREAMAQHDAIAQTVVAQFDGHLVKERGEGDSLFLLFDRATNAVAAALALQLAFTEHSWPTSQPVRVRMAIGTGEAQMRGNDYYGSSVNRIARLRAIGHGGEVLVAQSTRDLVEGSLASDISLLDMGEHQLADLTRPEHVWRLAGAGLAADLPPLKSLGALPNNLPRQTTSFIGREQEIADIRALLAKHSLVTVTGSGGVGKSRICFQLAADLLSQFPDGVWASELAPTTTGEQAQERIAASVNVTGANPVASLVSALKMKSMLLVIDNCEHVVEAVRSMAAEVAANCRNVRILATSRERLDVPGEALYRLPSLGIPDPDRLPPLAAIADYDSIRLFLQRAQLVDAGFEVTNGNAAAVAGICSRLDGIPLAIELAASRVKVLAPAEILARLNQRFRLLTGGSRLALPRQQTLLATIEWGYDLLNQAEKLLLMRLSVFVAGWTMKAAQQICSGDGIDEWDVLDLITALIDKSMVLPYDDRWGGQRYRMLETVLQFASEKLEAAGLRDVLRERHAQYFERLAQADRDHTLACEADQRRVRDIDHLGPQDRGNFRAAFEYLCEPGVCVDADRPSLLYQSASAETGLQWRTLFDKMRRSLPLVPTPACANALQHYATYFHISGLSPTDGLAACMEAIAFAAASGDQFSLCNALQGAGECLDKLGRAQEADKMFSESVTVAAQSGFATAISNQLINLAFRAFQRGEYSAAYSKWIAVLQDNENRNQLYLAGFDATHAGRMAYLLGKWSEARRLFDRAADHFEATGADPGLMLRHRADLNCATGHYVEGWNDLLASHVGVLTHNIPLFLAVDFESAAYLHACEAVFDVAAKLLGAANARRAISEARFLPEQQEYDKIRALIVAGIGEQECARLIDEGDKLTDDQASSLVVRMAAPTPDEALLFEDM